MKKVIYLLILTFVCILTITGCSCSSDKEKESNAYTDETITASNKAYVRGKTEGMRISNIEDEALRQRALNELQGLISALERNGYKQTASDFAEGLNSVVGK